LKLKVTIDGKTYEVEVEATESEPRRTGYISPAGGVAHTRGAAPSMASPAQPVSGSPADESKICRSPIAGIVVRVLAQVGQTIQTNDVLIVLEAMKMETTITSPVAGKVAKVNVIVGDPVKGGQILIEFE
jgi:biotin carboxyl carrier protein